MADLMTLVFGSDEFVPEGPPDEWDDGGPSDVDGPPPADDAWVCAKCGREVPKRRGRRPKTILCDDHRSTTGATAKTSSGSSTPRLSKEASQEHRLKKISGDLQEGLGHRRFS